MVCVRSVREKYEKKKKKNYINEYKGEYTHR
jgi:hypothetical protein